MQKELAVDYFDRHPSSNECHITSDGRVFHTIGSAQGFASALKNNTIESFKREEIDVKNIDVNDPNHVTGDTGNGGTGDDDEKAQAIEALRNFDASKAEYPEIKALVKALGLGTPTLKQPDLLAALEIAKANLEPKA